MQFSRRAQSISPFYVMEMSKAAQQIAAQAAGSEKPMIFLNIGEPDFTAPAPVQAAAARAIGQGLTQYTPALGLDALREAVSGWYAQRFALDVPAQRIVITAGASAALHLACLALLDAGDEVLMPDPCYPCNRQFVHAAGGTARLLPAPAAQRYQLDAQQVARHWGERTRGVLLASPANPTGTSIAPQELRAVHDVVRGRGGFSIIDEIYLGLSFDAAYGETALRLGDDIISINSFSKYFSMTGWRLGWMVVPQEMVPVLERLVQNLFICPSAVAQHAALACFTPQALAEYEARRAQFQARRDFFVPALRELGFDIPVMPDGAFYAWADASSLFARLGVSDSWGFARELMQRAHLAVTPGQDFGPAQAAHGIRFSTASSLAQLQQAVQRLQALLG